MQTSSIRAENHLTPKNDLPPENDGTPENYVTDEVRQVVRQIQKREMVLPALLLLTAHQPLAFVAGQILHVASPLAQMSGWRQCADWANLLSSPNGLSQLEGLLQLAQRPGAFEANVGGRQE